MHCTIDEFVLRTCGSWGATSSGFAYLASSGCSSRPTSYDFGEVQPGVYFDVDIYVANQAGSPQANVSLSLFICK